jgi:hypothetical protein
MFLVIRGRGVDRSLTESYAARRSSPPAPRVLDQIGFTRPWYPVRIKRAPYPLIVKPSYPLPLYPVRSLGPVNPAGSLGSVAPAGSLRPLNPCGSRKPSGTGDPWYHRGILNAW